MNWTNEHKWALLIEHTEEPEVKLSIVPYKGGLHWMYKLLDCRCVEHLTAQYFFKEYPINEVPHSDLWIDDEGKLDGKLPTFPIYNNDGILVDVISGNMLFFNGDDETGESHGLTHEEALAIAYWAMSVLGCNTRFSVKHDIPDLHAFTMR